MTRPHAYKIVTANRLRDGAVVYRAADGSWRTAIFEAELAASEQDAAELLARAERDVTAALVVAPYLIDVLRTDEGLVPGSLRERIRAAGPTIQPLVA